MEEQKELEVLTLAEIKEFLGADQLRVVDSKKKDEAGEPLRGKVYHGKEEIGLVKKGLLYKDLKEREEDVVAVRCITEDGEDLGWVFTFQNGGVL